jgi:hypothetical protein
MQYCVVSFRAFGRATLGTFVVFAISHAAVLAAPITSNLVLELKASAGVTQSAGLVSDWADQSTQGNSVSQGGADTLKPQLITGVTNGSATFDVIRFDGTSDVLSRTSGVSNLPTSSTGGTIFLVYRTSAAAGTFQNAYGIGVGTDANRISSGLSVGTSWSTRTRTGTAGAAGSTSSVSSAEAGGGGVPLANAFYVQAAVWDGSGGATNQLSKLLLPNGSIVTGADTGGFPAAAFVPTQLNIGMLQTTPSAGTTLQGDIAELLVYNVALSADEQAAVFNYLGTAYGVVPEPATAILAVTGWIGLLLRRNRM